MRRKTSHRYLEIENIYCQCIYPMFVANTWYNFMAQVHNTKMAPVPQVQNTKMAPVHWLSRHFQGQGISMLVWTSNFPLFSILPSECAVGHWLSRHFRSSRAFQCLCGHLIPRYFLSISNHGFLMLKRTSNFPLCSIVTGLMLTMNRNVCIIDLSILFVVISWYYCHG